MLKCGHIFCLDCILDKGMTYSECFVCKMTESVAPSMKKDQIQEDQNSEKKRKIHEEAITILSESVPVTPTKEPCEVITINKSDVRTFSSKFSRN